MSCKQIRRIVKQRLFQAKPLVLCRERKFSAVSNQTRFQVEDLESNCLMIRPGTPATTQKSGMSLVTTALAPITQLRPMQQESTDTFSPIHDPAPIFTGPFDVTGWSIMGTNGSSYPCMFSEMGTPFGVSTFWPILIRR